MENTLNNISEKSKIIFVDGIPDKKDSNGNNIARDLSDTYKNAVFFTDDSNVPDNEKETGNKKEYYNIWKGGKRYTKFQDVKDGNYISIGTHKIYLKNDNGFLYLVQGKDITDLEINSVLQQTIGNTSFNTTNISTTINTNNNQKIYNPTDVTIDSVDNAFRVKYTVRLKSNLTDENNNELDDNSGDKSLKFSFWTKNSNNNSEYDEAPIYISYDESNSSLTNETYYFKCLRPTEPNVPVYIKATSEYDSEIYCYYPFNINLNILNIIFRNMTTGEIITNNTIYMTVGEIMNVSFEYSPIEANKIDSNIYDVNGDYCNISLYKSDKYFEVTAINPTNNLINGYTMFTINIGNKTNIFKIYIKQIVKYYWYIGIDDPISILEADMTKLPQINENNYSTGFHVLNENANYTQSNPLIDAEYNPIEFGNYSEHYILLPNKLINDNDINLRHEIISSNNGLNTNVYEVINDNYIYNEISYTLYKSIVPAERFVGKIF